MNSKETTMIRRLRNFSFSRTLLMAALLAALLLPGCSQPTGDDDGGDTSPAQGGEGRFIGSFTSSAGDKTGDSNRRFYSLSLGKELDASKAATREWDIAMAHIGGFFFIYTNSGTSAAKFGSGGRGGVWFTDTTNYTSVTSIDDRETDFSGVYAEYEPYVTDVDRYFGSMDGTTAGRMNIMTYYGFYGGDGLTQATGFELSPNVPFVNEFYEFDRRAFTYAGTTMPPTWSPTNQVYIIRHGDGLHYSKLQVTVFQYATGYNFYINFRYKNLPDGAP
jgi:hypothetical protein